MPEKWDIVGAFGVSFVVAGLTAIYWPAALIVAGLGLCGLYYLHERR